MKILKVILLSLLLFIIFTYAVIFGLRFHGIVRINKSQAFLSKVLLLIAKNDSTYHTFVSTRAQEEISSNKQNITDNFTISFVDYDWGTYDFRIIFSDPNECFRATVSINNTGEFVMTDFCSDY